VSLYAATKKANELMAHSYSHLFRLPCTGLRFFTVYGPWGRPDMALFKFTRGILAGEPIPVYNRGQMHRDFTYVDDIVEGVLRVVDRPATADPRWDAKKPNPSTSNAPWRVFNIGNNDRVPLLRYIEGPRGRPGEEGRAGAAADAGGRRHGHRGGHLRPGRRRGLQAGHAGRGGVRRFADWYREYYRVPK
jgi:UDP-glucuronate 4-epimerase